MSEAASVALRLALPLPLPQLFDYLPPPGEQPDDGWIGCRARVPFGSRVLVGVIVAVVPEAGPGLRAVEARLDIEPLLTRELWNSLHWAAGYYHRALGDVIATALPGPLREGQPLPDTRPFAWRLSAAGEQMWQRLRPGAARRLAERLAGAVLPDAMLAPVVDRPALRSLRRRGLVEPCAMAPAPRPSSVHGPALSAEQGAAVEAICAAFGRFEALLLDGVTGSGKTEVYLRAIEACLARGQQALVLVPEIGLTPQALQRYGQRLSVAVASLHSGLSHGERTRAWTAMRRGDARVLVGTRSAVFCPLPDAGLIVVDEEHDASYKQQDGFRYHARDLALVRGKALGVPVVLGSATPSLESLHRCASGRCLRLRLPHRAGGARTPRVQVLDVRQRALQHGLSEPLIGAIRACLERGEQALVFRNRRGYAPALLCHDCGWSARCARCDAALTLHARPRLICHHCGAQHPTPTACPDCGGLGLVPQGAGTERLEQALAEAFPDTPLIRVDRETTRHRGALQAHFDTLGHQPGVLVGTQMLAKGHDLPLLTLVAIASIDEGLFSADFRATERLAQLLIQVAGRAGRAQRPGEVWLQTHHPDHPLLQTLVHGGYAAYADAALEERAAAGFPPFAHLALLRAEASTLAPVDTFLRRAHALASGDEAVEVHAPVPAPMALRAGRHRGQMLLSSARRAALHTRLEAVLSALGTLPEARKVRWSIDIDPMDLY